MPDASSTPERWCLQRSEEARQRGTAAAETRNHRALLIYPRVARGGVWFRTERRLGGVLRDGSVPREVGREVKHAAR